MSDPEKDIEFGPYFSKKWSEELRLTLHNFLSTILFNTPSPKVIFAFLKKLQLCSLYIIM